MIDAQPAVSKSVVFLYEGGTQPCDPPAPGAILLPLGSGFIVGLTQEGATPWRGWKFLATAHHVVAGRTDIIVRFNSSDGSRLICHPVKLVWSGGAPNVIVSAKKEVDLALISIPDVPGTDPTIFDIGLISDDAAYRSLEIREGTAVYTLGYLFGYSGHKQNYPVTKFGRVALLTEEAWYRSPAPRNYDEQAYVVELQNVPGLSGAPVMLESPQFRVGASGNFEYRRVPPHVVGVIKGALGSPLGGSQGVAAIEPAKHLKAILRRIADDLKNAGERVKLD